jgi:hypothetical protein
MDTHATVKIGIVWFGNHTECSSNTLPRSRCSREFSFGYFSFAVKRKVTLSEAIRRKVKFPS